MDVVDFITSLEETHLHESWMPYTSYLLVTAATVLLHCTVECGDIETKKVCVRKLVHFRDRLHNASQESGWDLADFCLERCQEPIGRLSVALAIPIREDRVQPPQDPVPVDLPIEHPDRTEIHAPGSSASLSDFFVPIDSLDYPWETLWDTFEGPRPIHI